MLDRNDNRPLYYQIKMLLKSLISTMEANEAIPGELELAQQYNVSRGTVKQAIMSLVQEGILYRIQGKGTFVAEKIKRSFQRLPSFTDDIRRLGYTPKSKIIHFSIVEADSKIIQALRLPEGSNVYQYKRLVFCNGSAIALVSSFLRIDIYPSLTISDIGDSLYDTLLKKYNKTPVSADDTYTPMNADHYLSSLLQVDEGTAILYSERTAYLDSNLPVEFVRSYIRGDRFMLEVNISSKQVERKNGKNEPNIDFRFRDFIG